MLNLVNAFTMFFGASLIFICLLIMPIFVYTNICKNTEDEFKGTISGLITFAVFFFTIFF
ncbi:MAG: hypothetical protein IJH34_03340 [Romboutsia sp.]|nr:hypothetical protein [Romboutsia sp.]